MHMYNIQYLHWTKVFLRIYRNQIYGTRFTKIYIFLSVSFTTNTNNNNAYVNNYTLFNTLLSVNVHSHSVVKKFYIHFSIERPLIFLFYSDYWKYFYLYNSFELTDIIDYVYNCSNVFIILSVLAWFIIIILHKLSQTITYELLKRRSKWEK